MRVQYNSSGLPNDSDEQTNTTLTEEPKTNMPDELRHSKEKFSFPANRHQPADGTRSWLDIVVLVTEKLYLQELESGSGREYFHYKTEICSYIDRHWIDLWGSTRGRSATWPKTVGSIITTHKSIFKRGREKGTWGLKKNYLNFFKKRVNDSDQPVKKNSIQKKLADLLDQPKHRSASSHTLATFGTNLYSEFTPQSVSNSTGDTHLFLPNSFNLMNGSAPALEDPSYWKSQSPSSPDLSSEHSEEVVALTPPMTDDIFGMEPSEFLGLTGDLTTLTGSVPENFNFL